MLIKYKHATFLQKKIVEGREIEERIPRLLVFFISEGMFGEDINRALDTYVAQLNDVYTANIEVQGHGSIFENATVVCANVPPSSSLPWGAVHDPNYEYPNDHQAPYR